MTEKEIDKAIKKYGLDKCNNIGFDTPKRTYLTYLTIAIFERRNVVCKRIINDKKCEAKIFRSGNSISVHAQNVFKNYDDGLEHKTKNIKIIDFEII